MPIFTPARRWQPPYYGFKRVLAGAAIVLGFVAFIYGTATIMAFQPPV